MTTIDQAGNVRSGEELDIDTVDTYLKNQIPELQGSPEITQFPGGASNLIAIAAIVVLAIAALSLMVALLVK